MTRALRIESGATLVESIVVLPVLLLMGMGILQMALIYHAKSTLTYATFEAARAGAVEHALLAPMRAELGIRLAPLFGGDGTSGGAAAALARSRSAVENPVFTQLRILNPTREAFDDWGVPTSDSDTRFIPSTHLRHRRRSDIGPVSGVSLHDATLLKLEVIHGLDLTVPLVRQVLLAGMSLLHPEHLEFYAAGKFPVTAYATVRMQNDVWDSDVLSLADIESGHAGPDHGGQVGSATYPDSVTLLADANGELSSGRLELGFSPLTELANAVECNEFGLAESLELIRTEEYETEVCSVSGGGFGDPSADANPSGGFDTSSSSDLAQSNGRHAGGCAG